MYINFKKLLSSQLSIEEFMLLQMIIQKETPLYSLYEPYIKRFEELGLIEFQKTGKTAADRIVVTKKGATFVDSLTIVGMDPETLKLSQDAIDLYKNDGRDTPSLLTVQDRMGWFVRNTNFTSETILDGINSYLEESMGKTEYVRSLDNLIWRAVNQRYPEPKSLKNSLLYNKIVEKYGIDPHFYLQTDKGVLIDYIYGLSKLKVPSTGDAKTYSLTGSWKSEKIAFDKLKMNLFQLIKDKNQHG